MADDQRPEQTLPTDAFSVAFRQLCDNPGAVASASRIDLADFYGRRETWTVDTFRVEGAETVFVQKMSAAGALRLVLPPEVMTVITRQHDRVTTATRKRGARQAVETKRAKGIPVGNPDAFASRRSRKRRSE